LTETSSVCATNRENCVRAKSCGLPLPNTIIEIWDENNNPVKAGSEGEIVVSSDAIMLGYYNEINSGVYVAPNGNRYIKTGDIGYLDSDGYLFVIGRIKRTIKIAGVNVFPSEIESIVKQLDYIDEVCTIKVTYKDKPFLKVYVTIKNDSELRLLGEDQQMFDKVKVYGDIQRVCVANLMRHSHPRFVEIIKEMPHTKFGKVDFLKLEKK